MNPALRELDRRLAHVEKEVASIRRDFFNCKEDAVSTPSSLGKLTGFGIDKTKYRKLVEHLFEELGITTQPIDAEQLQARMKPLGLEECELSRAVIEAREE